MKNIVRFLVVAVLLATAVAIMPAAAQDDAVVIGTNAEYPPFESVDDDGAIIGFDIDLMNALAEDAGLEVEFVNTKWDGIFVALAEGEFDAVISAATITDEREEIIDFTDPYFNAGQTIAVSADMAESVAGPDDLAGLRIGVQLGTTGDEFASEIDGAEVVRFDEITLAFQALGAGEVDAIINDGPTSADIIANNPDLNAVIVGDPLTDEFYGIAVNPENSDLLDALNISLENIIADGTYAEIYEEWFGQQPPSEFMGEDMGDEEAMEGEDMMVDFTDPESVTMALLSTFFAAESPDDLLVFACPGGEDSPLFPDADVLAGFAGMSLADASNVHLESEVTDNVAVVTATADSTITLKIGEAEQEMPVSLLLLQLGINSVRLEQGEDGNWLVCPEAE